MINFFLFFSLINQSFMHVAQLVIQNSKSQPCMITVIKKLQSKCNTLNDLLKTQLAISFTNCILKKTGKKPITCQSTNTYCLNKIKGQQWSTLSTYLAHVDNLCHYYSQLNWRQQSQKILFGVIQSVQQTHMSLLENMNLTKNIHELSNQLSLKLLESLQLNKQASTQIKDNHRKLSEFSSKLNQKLDNVFEKVQEHQSKFIDIMSKFLIIIDGIGNYWWWLGIILAIFLILFSIHIGGIVGIIIFIIIFNVLIDGYSELPLIMTRLINIISILITILIGYYCLQNNKSLRIDPIQKFQNRIDSKLNSERLQRLIKKCIRNDNI